MTNAHIAPFVRGFNGPALLAEDVPGLDARNDFLSAMRGLATAPSDPDTRDKLHIAAQQNAASMYGSPSRDDKPYAQVGDTAIIPISGLLINRFGGSWGWVTGYNAIRSQLNFALGDASVSRIVLDVNSPGGMVSGCFELAADIRAAREKKPIMAVVDGIACSAAYALASQADRIVAAPSAYAGSIGVVAMHVSYAGMLEKEGIEVTFIKAGKHKVDGNPYEALSDSAKKEWQARVDAIYGEFLATVEAGRKNKMTADDARKTEARIYVASDALALGMIDAVATPQAALAAFMQGDGSQQQEKVTDMSEKKDAAAEQPKGPSEAEARAAERARINGILNHAEAKGRATLATHLATNTDLSVDAAAAILAASPKDAAPEQPKAQERDRLAEAMDQTDQPKVGAEGGKSDDPVSRILGAYSAATGVKIEQSGAKH